MAGTTLSLAKTKLAMHVRDLTALGVSAKRCRRVCMVSPRVDCAGFMTISKSNVTTGGTGL